jgi:hypothetical protein
MHRLGRSSCTHSISAQFLVLCLVILVVLTTISIVLTLPLTSATFSSNASPADGTSANLSNFQNNNETCSTWVEIAIEGGSENNTDILCLQKVLEGCRPFDIALGYALGSMRISIKGKGVANDADDCYLGVEH